MKKQAKSFLGIVLAAALFIPMLAVSVSAATLDGKTAKISLAAGKSGNIPFTVDVTDVVAATTDKAVATAKYDPAKNVVSIKAVSAGTAKIKVYSKSDTKLFKWVEVTVTGVAPKAEPKTEVKAEPEITAKTEFTVSTLDELQKAISEAGTSATMITLTKTINITTKVSINAEGKEITVLRATALKKELFSVSKEGSLTLANITIDGNKAKVSNVASIIFVDGGSVTMNDGAILKNNKRPTNDKGGAVAVYNGGRLNMKGGEISGCSAYQGGAVFLEKSTFVMDGGTICENNAERHGGAIYAGEKTNFILNDGTISNNTCKNGSTGSGGAVAVRASTFTMNGGTISGNTAANCGGGVFVSLSPNGFIMKDGEISDNKAYCGGGVQIENSSSGKLLGGKIINNTTKVDGAGVSIPSGSTYEQGDEIEISGNKGGSQVFYYNR